MIALTPAESGRENKQTQNKNMKYLKISDDIYINPNAIHSVVITNPEGERIADTTEGKARTVPSAREFQADIEMLNGNHHIVKRDELKELKQLMGI
jgi:hypothetical protein